MTDNLPDGALKSDWEEYWKDSEPVKQWLDQQMKAAFKDLLFCWSVRNGIFVMPSAYPGSGGHYNINTVLGLDKLDRPTKDGIKMASAQRRVLEECVAKIDRYIASYRPKGQHPKPVVRVKMGRLVGAVPELTGIGA